MLLTIPTTKVVGFLSDLIVRNEELIPFDNELFTRWRVTYTHACSYNMKGDENNKEIENFFQIL